MAVRCASEEQTANRQGIDQQTLFQCPVPHFGLAPFDVAPFGLAQDRQGRQCRLQIRRHLGTDASYPPALLGGLRFVLARPSAAKTASPNQVR
jgi:hypothetical protein